MYGSWQIGGLTPEDYVKKAIAFARVMKWTDPSIELIGCGHDGWSEWDRVVIEGLAPLVDYHSIHLYTGSADYYWNVFQPHQAERAIRICRAVIERARYERGVPHPIGIAYDEWNVWFRERGERSGLEERYTLADALAVATYLNVFVRHCAAISRARLAPLADARASVPDSSAIGPAVCPPPVASSSRGWCTRPLDRSSPPLRTRCSWRIESCCGRAACRRCR